MSLKSMQSLYKILQQELASGTQNLTPSKRGGNTKENQSKSVESSIMSLRVPL